MSAAFWTVAITGLLFSAIALGLILWDVAGDAPWENDSQQTSQEGCPDSAIARIVSGQVDCAEDEVRCQGALDYRAAIVASPPTRERRGVAITDTAALQSLLNAAEREITRYC